METFVRKKVNNWVSYPFVLDMNNFMLPYDEMVVQDDTEFLEERKRILAEEANKPSIVRHVDGDFEDPLRRRKRANRRPSPDEVEVKKAKIEEAVKDDFGSSVKGEPVNA